MGQHNDLTGHTAVTFQVTVLQFSLRIINMKEVAVFLQNVIQGGAGVNIEVREGRGRCLVANKQIEVGDTYHTCLYYDYMTRVGVAGGRRGAGGDSGGVGTQAVVPGVLCGLLHPPDVHQHRLVQTVQSPPL